MEQNQNPSQPHPQRNYSAYQDTAPVITVGNWIFTMLLMCIPLVNIIMLIVWAASSGENPNRKNWAIAVLIFVAIMVILWIMFFGMIIGTLGGLAEAFS